MVEKETEEQKKMPLPNPDQNPTKKKGPVQEPKKEDGAVFSVPASTEIH